MWAIRNWVLLPKLIIAAIYCTGQASNCSMWRTHNWSGLFRWRMSTFSSKKWLRCSGRRIAVRNGLWVSHRTAFKTAALRSSPKEGSLESRSIITYRSQKNSPAERGSRALRYRRAHCGMKKTILAEPTWIQVCQTINSSLESSRLQCSKPKISFDRSSSECLSGLKSRIMKHAWRTFPRSNENQWIQNH